MAVCGNVELHLQGLDALQVHEVLSGTDIVADADLTEPDDAVERRADPSLVQHGHGERRLGLVDAQLSLVFITLAGGAGALGQKLGSALVVLAAELQIGLRLFGFGLVGRIVDLKKHRPLLDRLAFLEIDALNAAGDFRTHDNGLARFERTHGGQRPNQGLLLNLGDLDGNTGGPLAWPHLAPAPWTANMRSSGT